MRFLPIPLFLACVSCACAQGVSGQSVGVQSVGVQSVSESSLDPPEVARAKANIERMKSLVDAGALPRVQLEKAESALADAEDEAFLRKTLYGTDLTDAESEEMMAAANRRFERRKKVVDEVKKLVEDGITSQ